MTPKLHIIFLVDAWFPFTGGGQIYARELKKVLETDFNYSIKLFHPPHHSIFVRLVWSLLVPFQVIMYSAKQKIDLIHSQGYNSGLAGKICSLLLGKPVIHTVHGSNLLDQEETGVKALLEKWLLTKIHYHHQITVSRSFFTHENVNDVSFVPNGVDVAAFDKIANNKTDNLRIIWVGRDDPVKGYDIFLEALEFVEARIPNVEVDIILGGHLTQTELIKRYKRATLFVQSSRSEGFSLTLLEAWAAKLPVVVTNVGENPALVEDGETGYLVESENPQELSDTIIKVLLSQDHGEGMGEKGHDLVSKNYSWVRVATQTNDIYQRFLKEI